MAVKKEFLVKLKTFRNAVDGFHDLLQVDLNKIREPILKDGVRNGQIQKFEYCTELTWKILKKFLYEFDGIDAKSPKDACKVLGFPRFLLQQLIQNPLNFTAYHFG